MLKALEAFERSPWANELGWEALINPDEEIGSPGSKILLEKLRGPTISGSYLSLPCRMEISLGPVKDQAISSSW